MRRKTPMFAYLVYFIAASCAVALLFSLEAGLKLFIVLCFAAAIATPN